MSESRRQLQVSEMLTHMAAEFFARESNSQSLITVTHADIAPDFKNATVFISVLPESYEEQVLHFARRQRPEFREYLKKHARLKALPFVEFEIDYGEKNRQRIDLLTQE